MQYKKALLKVLKNTVISALVLSVGFSTLTLAAEPTVITDPPLVWDGYVEEEQSSTVSLLDFNSYTAIVEAGGTPTAEYSDPDKNFSARWNNHLTKTDFWFDLKENDWSTINNINFKIYSAKATGATIYCIIYSPSATSATGNYFRYSFKIDWEGWKTITLKTSDFGDANSPVWTNVTQMRLVGHGNWNVQGNKDTDLYIADINIKKDFPMDSLDFYGEDAVAETLASLENSFAVYAGGNKATVFKGTIALGCEVEYTQNTVMIPVKIFADVFGAEVITDTDTYSVALNGVRLSGMVNSLNIKCNEEEYALSVAPYKNGNDVFVPGMDVGMLLGKNAYEDGRFLVVGTDAAVAKMFRAEHLGVNQYSEIASYLAYHRDIDVNEIQPSDVQVVKNNWKRYLVGDETTNDLSDPDVKARVQSLTLSALNSWNAMIKDSGSKELFSGISSVSSQDMEDAYIHLQNMAYGYSVYGGELYKNEELKDDILYGIEWMHKYRYGAESDTGWKITGFDNWVDWRISSPGCITQVLLLLEDEFTKSQIKTYLKYFDQNNYMPEYTGGNFLAHTEVIALSAILQEDYQRTLAALASLEKMYLYVDDNERITESQLRDEARKAITPMKGAGFFTDGSYILHTLHAMNGAYGASHLNTLSEFEKYFTGTVFELNAPFRYNVPEIFENSLASVIYGTTMYRHVMGRSDNPNNYTAGTAIMASAFSLSGLYSDEEKNMMQSIIKSAVKANPNAEAGIINNLPIDEIKAFKEFLGDDSIKAVEDVSDNKVFYNMDKVVHKTNEWSAGISMSSSRIFNYESINNQNMTGWYLGDGRTEYYLWGSDMNATTAYWASMDPYRLPGTTVDTQERQAVSVLQGNEYLSSKDFVGGVSLGRKYGVAAMDLESYHNETDYGAVSSGGGKNPAHQSDLTAKKAYFMFDDELVCIGTAVNAKANNDAEVLTIVDNLLSHDVTIVSEKNDNTPYEIKSAEATETPEPENVAANTIDDSLSTKWAAENLAEIVWDLGEEKELGFVTFAFTNGSKRQQKFELQVSNDGTVWESVFDGASSGKKESNESFDLQNKNARYLKFINKGNSAGSEWVSLCDCQIYPKNADGSIGFKDVEAYGSDRVVVDGKEINLLGDDYILTGAEWANAADKCGYVFPQQNSTNLGELKARRTNGMQSHFELWFSHGVNPTDSSYAYILLPGKSAEYTKAYAESSNTQILSNTSSLQAVRDNTLGATGLVFWESGSFEKITTDIPCIVMYSETDTEFKISVSDPTQKLKSGSLTIDMPLTATELDDMAEYKVENGKTVLTLNLDGSAGRSYEAVFTKGVAVPDENELFIDLADYEWAKESIYELAEKNIISKADNRLFRPSDNITREEFVKLIMQAFYGEELYDGEAKFTDAVDGAWYNKYVNAASEKGIVTGMGDGSFGVGKPITREDMVTIASRAVKTAGFNLDNAPESDFADYASISDYAVSFVDAMVFNGVVNGMGDGTFAPKNNAARAEAAKIIDQLINLYKQEAEQ